MKTFTLVRHAKSSWDNPNLSDHDRPLLEVGKKRTRKVIEKLRELHVHPDMIITSSAVRACETAGFIAKGLHVDPMNIKVSRAYYMATAHELLNEFFDMPDRFDSIMLVGHNPTMTMLANHFLNKPLDNLPTSGVVHLCFKAQRWEDIPKARIEIFHVLFPKKL